MTEPTLTAKDVQEALKAMSNAPIRRGLYLVHPVDADHLDRHDGGKWDCHECWRIWMHAEVARGL